MISRSILVTIILLLATHEINSSILPIANSSASCGNLNIPFPFRTTSNCCLHDPCHSYNSPKAFLNSSNIEALDGLMMVPSSVASDCYDDSGAQTNGTISELTLSKVPNSNMPNNFNANDMFSLVKGSEPKQVSGTRSGIGRHQISIPKGVEVRYSKNCLPFPFGSTYNKDVISRATIPSVHDRLAGKLTCEEAQKDLCSYACRVIHSECSDSTNGIGYRCHCLTGFQGDPYLFYGCEDIDECTTLKPCDGICTNLLGSYSCSCPKGFEGDGKKDGLRCHPMPKSQKTNASNLFYIISGLMVPALGISWIFWRHKKKKLVKLRQNLFRRNGGLILENALSRQRTLQVFTAEDLKKATDNYNENSVLSRNEYHEITYRGILSDAENPQVTIHKFHELEECESCDIAVFINKLVTLSRMNHKNVVKLIGCCLETPVPLLVYESINNKTLYDYIHDDHRECFLSWDIRLRIAAETAGALAYMHSATSKVPIIHGNLNSYSITLNHDYAVKLHDCGLTNSKLSGFELRRGFGYLDSEYFISGRLTEKSDIYSFGVVLAELLTGKKVISFERMEGEMRLSEHFVSLRRGDDLLQVLDHRLMTEGKIEQLTEVAKLAQRCLSSSSVDRPTMQEVVITLEDVISWNGILDQHY